MSPSRASYGLSASPVLVGAVTLLVTIVAVFLSYNANAGLPFVPTYDLQAEVPSAAQLVTGNEVRIGGARVGVIERIAAVRHRDGSATARLSLKLDADLEPLPADSTFVVRARSALGLKYLELTPGTGRAGFQAGATVPVRQARPRPVELDEVLNMFDARARRGAQASLSGFGSGLAGRGEDLNRAISELRPLLDDLEPVAANLAAPETQLARLFPALARTAAAVAPVAETQAELFGNLETTFAALARVGPSLRELVEETPPTLATGIREFPAQRPFLRNSTALFAELRPGFATLPAAAPALADAFDFGIDTLPRTPALNAELARVFDSLAAFSEDPLVPRGVQRLGAFARSLRPTLRFLAPVQTRCNYVTLTLRNVASVLSQGDSHGTWQRFIVVGAPLGPNNEGAPSRAPARGPQPTNYLHVNPYPNTASPGQPVECEAGNEPFLKGQTVTSNVPGTQKAVTEGLDGAGISAVTP